MSRVAVIGEGARVQGFVLAGALVLAAEDAAAVRAAWRTLPGDVAVVVLTPRAADVLREVTGLVGARLTGAGGTGAGGTGAGGAPPDGLAGRPGVLPVVMPGEASQGPAVTPP
ncbi:MAG TPA: V-type ATP synthase subunit F [Streptosporangiaceae bacterium]|nr:V-type ATP synthase subunit F [Streptosporangiaceae bacterium]